MGIVEFFKNLGSQLGKVARKLFGEDDIIEDNTNENDIIAQINKEDGLTAEEKKELKKALRGAFNKGDELDREQKDAIKLTPADRNLEEDSTMKDIRVTNTPKAPNKNNTPVKEGKEDDGDRTI